MIVVVIATTSIKVLSRHAPSTTLLAAKFGGLKPRITPHIRIVIAVADVVFNFLTAGCQLDCLK